MDIANYLVKKGINFKTVKRASGRQAMFPCPNCGDKSFSVNLDTGIFSCLRKNKCNLSGGSWKLQKLFGDEPKRIETECNRETYGKPQSKLEEPNDKVKEFFEGRKLDYNLAVKHFKVNRQGNSIAFRYFYYGEHIATKFRDIGQKNFRNEPDCRPSLYNLDNCRDSDKLYITEGELDCIAFKQMTGIDAVSVQNGTSDHRWIESNWDDLEAFSEIILIFDTDKAGQDGVVKVAKRLGELRCHNVLLPANDVNECLVQGIPAEQIFEAITRAKPMAEAKVKSAGTFSDELIEFMNNPDLIFGMPLITMPALTSILKGLRPGEVTVWTGSNGSGKSTMLNMVMIDLLKQSLKVCVASLEMIPRSMLKWMMMQSLKENSPSEEKVRKTLDILNDRLYIVDIQKKIPAKEILDHFRLSYRKHGCKFFFLDSLMKIRLDGGEKGRLQAEADFMGDLTDFAKEVEGHVILIAHPRKGLNDSQQPDKVDVKGTSELTDLAHNVLVSWRPDAEYQERYYKQGFIRPHNVLFVKKNREHGTLGQILFRFDKETKVMRELKDQPRQE